MSKAFTISRVKSFEEVIAWQQAKELTEGVYANFKMCKDHSFKDQVRRAAVSVMNNIAEGLERNSDKEFKHYLYIAKGSCGEVRSMLSVALPLGYIDPEQQKQLICKAVNTSKLLAGFIKKL